MEIEFKTQLKILDKSGILVQKYKPLHNIIKSDNKLYDFTIPLSNIYNESSENPIYPKLCQMIIQKSYDDSLNLIISNDKHTTQLINTRFSVTKDNMYEIVDRYGSGDTNLYNYDQIKSESILFKTYFKYPQIDLISVTNGGVLPVGQYCIYIKYSDEDGNETNIASESGIIACYIGQGSYIDGSYANHNSNKQINIKIKNVDTSYDYINIYYSRYSSDQFELTKTSIFKVLNKYPILNRNTLNITINGNENTQEITQSELNNDNEFIYNNKTQALLSNRIFLGNLQKTYINYSELTDLSLRIVPTLKITSSGYSDEGSMLYADTQKIYNNVGYWGREIYRFGIVYIYSNNTLSPVFNILGNKYTGEDINSYSSYKELYPIFTGENNRTYVKINPETHDIIGFSQYNNLGVSRLNYTISNKNVIGIQFNILDKEKFIDKLIENGITGFFFVRQKRIPMVLAQGLVLNHGKNLHVPIYKEHVQTINESNKLTISGSGNPYKVKQSSISTNAYCIICPEFEVRQPYYSQIFNSNEFILNDNKDEYITANLVAVKEDVPSVRIKKSANEIIYFSSRAGEASDAMKFKYDYATFSELKNHWASKPAIVRGIYGPYIGAVCRNLAINQIVNIYISGWSEDNMNSYFKLRYEDDSPYYTISDRLDINSTEDIICYRGDCHICTFIHRLNRNFQDPSAPNNDELVKTEGYNNVKYEDGAFTNKETINLGDINAVRLGEWVRCTVCSTSNVSIRSIDDTNASEIALTGNTRSFVPYRSEDTSGSNKIPDSYFINEGFSQSLGQRIYFTKANIPYIRNNFTNQIAYSELNINDGYQNGLRIFKLGNNRNYNLEYGQIVKLVTLGSQLIVIFEHGIISLQIDNSQAIKQIQYDDIINTGNILPENPSVISDMYGSKWIESIITTQKGIYGIDTDAKRIWFVNSEGLKVISDFFVNSFLEKNIDLSPLDNDYCFEKDKQHIVAAHYNAHKQDVMFTIKQDTKGCKSWNLCYNEMLQKWQTFYSWIPTKSTNINNVMYSFNKDTKLYKHNVDAKPCYWYDEQHPFEFEFTVIDSPLTHKIFDNMIIVSNKTQPESFHYTITGDCYNFANQKEYMYFRQEATNSYLHNAEWPNDLKYNVIPDTTFISDKANNLNENPVQSVMFPNVYYSVDPNTNTLYDQWIEQTSEQGRNYAALSGTTLVRNGQEIHIQEHSPARDITNPKYGRSRGNMHYREDRWFIQISPINLLYRNEPQKVKDKYPYVVLSNLPQNVVQYAPKITNWKIDATLQKLGYNTNTIDFSDWGTLYNYQAKTRKEIKLKDKYIKIKVRYKGDKQAFIHSILTKYTEVL